MPITHKVEDGLLVVERTGPVSTHDERRALETRKQDAKITRGIPVLVDCRTVEPADSVKVIHYLADQITSHAKHLQCGPVAIVVSTDVEFGMARMYQILTEDTHPHTRIFRSVDQAKQWLQKRTDKQAGAV